MGQNGGLGGGSLNLDEPPKRSHWAETTSEVSSSDEEKESAMWRSRRRRLLEKGASWSPQLEWLQIVPKPTSCVLVNQPQWHRDGVWRVSDRPPWLSEARMHCSWDGISIIKSIIALNLSCLKNMRENPKQALHSAWSLTQSLTSWPWDYDMSWNQEWDA